jgi:hypothetical protein
MPRGGRPRVRHGVIQLGAGINTLGCHHAAIGQPRRAVPHPWPIHARRTRPSIGRRIVELCAPNTRPDPTPPATKTLPSVNSVAVGSERALTIAPALAHPAEAPAAGALRRTPAATRTARLDIHARTSTSRAQYKRVGDVSVRTQAPHGSSAASRQRARPKPREAAIRPRDRASEPTCAATSAAPSRPSPNSRAPTAPPTRVSSVLRL